ncbi:MAG: GtrA family protein [Dissulfurimicrobium sp.]|uniref:GtrA family protein n=1 Tax=Dissulfurimicrobium sp. TaxID=2022436 RepID=UPI003D0AB149
MVGRQILRYILVGSLSNILLYLLYIALTTLGVGPKMAMTGLFALGVLQTFILNKRWTFAHAGDTQRSLFRYLIAYGGCYLLNLSILILFVDHMGMPHQIVQGVAIVFFAALLFLLQKYWIFTNADKSGQLAKGVA